MQMHGHYLISFFHYPRLLGENHQKVIGKKQADSIWTRVVASRQRNTDRDQKELCQLHRVYGENDANANFMSEC